MSEISRSMAMIYTEFEPIVSAEHARSVVLALRSRKTQTAAAGRTRYDEVRKVALMSFHILSARISSE